MTDRHGTLVGTSHSTTQEKGKVPSEEQNQKMSGFSFVSISEPAGGRRIVLAGVELSCNLSCCNLLDRSLDAAIKLITRGWTLWSN